MFAGTGNGRLERRPEKMGGRFEGFLLFLCVELK